MTDVRVSCLHCFGPSVARGEELRHDASCPELSVPAEIDDATIAVAAREVARAFADPRVTVREYGRLVERLVVMGLRPRKVPSIVLGGAVIVRRPIASNSKRGGDLEFGPPHDGRMTEQNGSLAVSIAKAAAALDISQSTLRRMARRGEIRLARVGRRLRVPRTEIERLLMAAPIAKRGAA